MSKDAAVGEQIKSEVRKRYGDLITEGHSSCCGPEPSCCQPTGRMRGTLVQSAGYAPQELLRLPGNARENALGCGNPLAFSEVREGETVLDIGSGAGIDCFIAAEKVGQAGRVIGLDMTPEMIDKARENARAGGYANVEFRLGEAEAMPVEAASVDWVISNCVINLSPDKPRVFAEIARVLKPGGRFAISDIVLGDALPDEIAQNMQAWTSCVAGAIKEVDYVGGLRRAGLEGVDVPSRLVYDAAMIGGFLAKADLGADRAGAILEQVQGKIWSAKIVGRKPKAQARRRGCCG